MKLGLILYVTGMSPLSVTAIENLKIIYKKIGMPYNFKVIDILKHPEIAKEKNIVATPLLEKMYPVPVTKIIGDLSDVENILFKLNLIDMKMMSK